MNRNEKRLRNLCREVESRWRVTSSDKHHPDYDPELGCGSLYVQEEVAVQMMLAIAYSLENNEVLTELDKTRLCVGATVINNVFALGAEEER